MMIADITFERGFNVSRPALDAELVGTRARGSRNQLILGDGRNRPFAGTTDIGANKGSRIMTQLGNTWGGLKDINKLVSDAVTNSTSTVTSATASFTSALNDLLAIVVKADGSVSGSGTVTYVNSTTITLSSSLSWTSTGNTLYIVGGVGGTLASGSLWQDIGRSLWFIGAGSVHKEGTDFVNVRASSILQTLVFDSGSYSSANSGPYTAGLSQPSSPDVAPTSTLGITQNAVSFKIARIRTRTGARSIASITSVVIVPAGHKVRVTFPLAATGQDNWALFRTQEGFGGVGVHYRAPYNGSLDISETVVAASTVVVDGVTYNRSIEVDIADSDLIDDTAWIDDYPPPAGTHAARIENVMLLMGCYADATASPTSSNTGTAIAVSLPNFYESFKPRNLLYLPENIVTTLQRPSDSFVWVACRNSIHLVQYVGLRDGPACTISTPIPDVGIAYPHNWCQIAGRLVAYVAKGTLMFLDENGQFDESFANPIRDYIKGWTQENTIVSWKPETRQLWIMNGDTGLAYSLENRRWSDPCHLPDYLVTGNVLSCVTSQSELFVTVTEGTNNHARKWDTGGNLAPITTVSPVIARPQGSQSVLIQFPLEVAINTDRANEIVGVCLQRNMRRIYARDIVSTSPTNSFSSATAAFTTNDNNAKAIMFGKDIGGLNIHVISGKVTYVNSTTITLTDANGNPVNAQTSLTGVYMLIGVFAQTVSITRNGEQHLANLFPLVTDARSYQVAVGFWTSATEGQVLNVQIAGMPSGVPTPITV